LGTLQNKFFGEQSQEHGSQLFWSSALPDGLPFRGANAPLLTKKELETQVEIRRDFKNGIYELNDPEQNKEYTKIMDRIGAGWYQLVYRIIKDVVDEQSGKLKVLVYVEWMQRYGELSPHAKAARQESYAQYSFGPPLAGNQSAGF
jgi:hypothetical protein